MPTRPMYLTPALLLSFTLAACAGGDADRDVVLRADSAGIEVVTNSGVDRPLTWTFQPLARMGAADGPDVFGGTFTGGIASDGERIYVLDAITKEVIVFAADGTEFRRFGRRGGGPGEFEFPYALTVEPDGVVGVAAFDKRALVRFDSLGAPLEERRFDDAQPGDPVSVMDDGLVHVTALSREQADSDTPTRALVHVREGSADTIARLAVTKPRFFQLPDCAIGLNVPPLLAPELVWTATSDGVYWSAGATAAVHVWADGSTRRIIRRTIDPIRATIRTAAAEMPDTYRISAGAYDCRIPAEKVVEVQGYSETAQHVVEIAAAPDGRLWVRRRTVDGTKPIDVFAADGTYLGTLPPDSPWPSAFLDDGTMLSLETDELDLQSVVRYRIES